MFGIAPLIRHFAIRYQAKRVSASLAGLRLPGYLAAKPVEREIELQHVDARLAEQAKQAAFGLVARPAAGR